MQGSFESGVILHIADGEMEISLPSGMCIKTKVRKNMSVGDEVKFTYNYFTKAISFIVIADEYEPDTITPHELDHPEIEYGEGDLIGVQEDGKESV